MLRRQRLTFAFICRNCLESLTVMSGLDILWTRTNQKNQSRTYLLNIMSALFARSIQRWLRTIFLRFLIVTLMADNCWKLFWRIRTINSPHLVVWTFNTKSSHAVSLELKETHMFLLKPSHTPHKDLLTAKQAARYLSISTKDQTTSSYLTWVKLNIVILRAWVPF